MIMWETLKDILLYAVIFLPFALIFNVLETYFSDTWWPAIIVSALIIMARIGLHLYCRAKGLRDKWD